MSKKKIIHYLRALHAENIKCWRIDLSYRTDFVRSLIEPLFYVLPYVLYGLAIVGGRESPTLRNLVGTGDIVTFTVLGYIFMGFLNTGLWAMGMSIRKEQWFGTLEAVFSTPVPRWVYTAGMALHSTVHQGSIILVQMILLSLILGLSLNLWVVFPSLGVIALMLLALYGLGMMLAALTLTLKQWWVIVEILHGLITMLTPIAYPLVVLPTVLRHISSTLPTTYAITSLRHFTLGEMMPWSVTGCLVRLGLLSIGWITFGLLIFRIIERRVSRTGEIATY